ncbi:MAG: hypothetical protein ACKOXK_07640 [Chakrabartia sp.]
MILTREPTYRRWLAALSLAALFTSSPLAAQNNANQNGLGGIANLLGAIAQSAAKSNAKKGWAQTSEPIQACVNTALSSKNVTVDQLIAAGIGPTDKRVAPLITSCDQILSAQLKTNIACTVTNAKGQQVQSTCNQVFAKEENGSVSEITRDEFIQRAGSGEKIQIAILETTVANNARLAEEERQAEVERQRYLASPEGKRQAAAAAAKAKQEAAARRIEAAREAERNRIAETQLTPAQASKLVTVWVEESWVNAWERYAREFTIRSLRNGLYIIDVSYRLKNSMWDCQMPLFSNFRLDAGRTMSDNHRIDGCPAGGVVKIKTNMGTMTLPIRR